MSDIGAAFLNAFGIKEYICARIKAEPGFHVLFVPTADASIGCEWVEVTEWGLCTGRILSLDIFSGETTRMIPLENGKPIARDGRIALGGCFPPGVTADDALEDVFKRKLAARPLQESA